MTNSSISPVLSKILRTGRLQFNARVAEAKHRYPAFKTENFTNFLIESVDPLVQSVDKIAPDYCGNVTVAAYDIALNLVARDLAGPHIHNQRMTKLWQDIFPELSLHIIENSQLVIGALSNALVNIESLPNSDPDQWLAKMQKFSPKAGGVDQLLKVGMLSAWCSGAAHFRQAALRVAATLPEVLVLDLMGVDKKVSISVLLHNLEKNPWWFLQLQTASEKSIQIEVGAFSGLGGHFSVPPKVRVNDDGFVVKSGDRYNILIADSYGSVILPASKEEFNAASKFTGDSQIDLAPVLQGSHVIAGNKAIELQFPANGLELASNEHTIAVTSSYSFAITLVPR